MSDSDKPRILCVDDNADAADSEVELLRIVGFESLACYDGEAAVAAAREFGPDVCLIDLHMPRVDGTETATRIRAEAGGRAILFVAVTAMNDEASRQRLEAAGFHFHLVKPVDPHSLLKIVDELWKLKEEIARSGAEAQSHAAAGG